MSEPVARLAARMGVVLSHKDLDGVVQVTGRDTQVAVLRAMGIDCESEDTARALAASRA